jgi:hypothetical protein
VGEDLHWKPGLDFFRPYGLPLTIISHWNNNDGGEEIDTSRCYMGEMRFEQLLEMLPEEQTIVGIDEHTSIILDFAASCCFVRGNSTVTILRDGQESTFETGSEFPLDLLGAWRIPENNTDIPASVWQLAEAAEAEREAEALAVLKPPQDVLAIAQAREEARTQGDWEAADRLREQIADLGWQVNDTPEGSELSPLDLDPQP